MFLSKKPDEIPLLKLFFWHSSIIHHVANGGEAALFRRSFKARFAIHAYFALRLCLRSISCSFPLSFKLFLSLPMSSWAFCFRFYTGKVSFNLGPSCFERRQPSSLLRRRRRNRPCLDGGDVSVSCICAQSLTLQAHSPSLSVSSTSSSLHNSFCSCIHFPSCPKSMFTPSLCKPEKDVQKNVNRKENCQ